MRQELFYERGITLAYLNWEMIAQLWVSSYIYPLTWNPEIKGWPIFIQAAKDSNLAI